jgi:SOS response regulatory protein OraA/RecX
MGKTLRKLHTGRSARQALKSIIRLLAKQDRTISRLRRKIRKLKGEDYRFAGQPFPGPLYQNANKKTS